MMRKRGRGMSQGSTQSTQRSRFSSGSNSTLSRSQVNLGLKKTKKKKANQKEPKDYIYLGIGFPRKLGAILRYYDCVAFNAASNGNAAYQFSCNGLFDPNITGTGHQPLYFDQYMAIYDHYTVLGSKIIARAVPTQGTNINVPMVVVCYVNDDTTVTPAFKSCIEQSGAVVGYSGPYPDNAVTLVQTWSAYKYFGGTPLANDNLQGTSGANPSEQSYYQLIMQAADGDTGATSAKDCQLHVTIEFNVVFDELRDIAGS